MRVLFFSGGVLVGTESSLKYERLGHILRRAGILGERESEAVLARETRDGTRGAPGVLEPKTLLWALERRAFEIAANLPLLVGAHFAFVDGPPDMSPLPRIAVPPMDLAMDGLRRYDEWRNGRRAGDRPAVSEAQPRPTRDPPAPRPPPTRANGSVRATG